MAVYSRRPSKRLKYVKRGYKKRINRLTKSYAQGKNLMSIPRLGKFFPGLPQNCYQMCPVLGDTRYGFDTFSSTLSADCHYVFWDPIDFSRDLNTSFATSSGQKWYKVQLLQMMALYQEARFKMTKLSIDVSLDSISTNFVAANSQNPPDRIDLSLCVVPLTYLKTSAGVAHTATQAGTWFTGVDYYSASTHKKGTQFFSLTTDGNKSNYKASQYIDGYAHNGITQSILSNMTFSPLSDLPTQSVTYPNPSSREVFLLSVRFRCHSDTNINNTMYLRISAKMEAHMHFCDPVANWPYATSTGII